MASDFGLIPVSIALGVVGRMVPFGAFALITLALSIMIVSAATLFFCCLRGDPNPNRYG